MKASVLTMVTVMAVLVAGCSSDPVLTIGSNTLTVKDQIYVSQTGYICNGLAPNQASLKLVDYGPACSIDRPAGSADPRDAAVEHSELDLIVSFGGNPMWTLTPFDATGDCDNGGANAAVIFHHYAANSQTPDKTLSATAGTIRLTSFDMTGSKPANGTFDITVGGSELKGSINSYSCNL